MEMKNAQQNMIVTMPAYRTAREREFEGNFRPVVWEAARERDRERERQRERGRGEGGGGREAEAWRHGPALWSEYSDRGAPTPSSLWAPLVDLHYKARGCFFRRSRTSYTHTHIYVIIYIYISYFFLPKRTPSLFLLLVRQRREGILGCEENNETKHGKKKFFSQKQFDARLAVNQWHCNEPIWCLNYWIWVRGLNFKFVSGPIHLSTAPTWLEIVRRRVIEIPNKF